VRSATGTYQITNSSALDAVDCRSLSASYWLLVLTLLISILPNTAASAPSEKLIGPGAIISVRGPVSYVSTFSQETTTNKVNSSVTLKHLAKNTLFIDFKLPGQFRIKTQLRPSPIRYSRKTNPCKRAKLRRYLASMKIRARCEPNWAYKATITPNDPEYSLQYASSFLSLPAAWDQTTGNSNLVAVVIDTGIQVDHPDLAANIWINPGEVAGNGIDDDSNGYIDDVHGINAITGSGNPNDDNGHGTHCAGILGAKGNNSAGIAGVSWNGKIAAAKFLDSSGSGYTSDAIEAINYSIALKQAGNNVVVSNNSWGGGGYSAALYTAIQQATSAGILFVAAAGNDTLNTDVYPSYPASYDLAGIITVASSSSSGDLSYFSNFGTTSVDIAAPGSAIKSSVPTSSYATYSGTSMAAPQVTGIALLVQSICNGSLTVSQIKAAILNSGVAYASLSGLVATGSIANANGSVTTANATCNGAPSATPTNTPENTPTDTPVPSTPTNTPEPEQPTATPEPARGSDPNRPLTIALNPDRSLKPQDTLRIDLDNAGSATQASLVLTAKDTNKRSYSCSPVRIAIADGATSENFILPSAIRQFSSITIVASASRKTAKDTASVANPSRNRTAAAGRRALTIICNALRQATK
jgi:subtilisin family serine protease